MTNLESKQFRDALELNKFKRALKKETDRGVALTCAAYIDDRLKVLLENTCVDAPKVTGRIFGPVGPLATFSSKIDMVFLLGMMEERLHRGIHLIRKIRNSFAHYHMPRSFDDPDLSAQCRELGKSVVSFPPTDSMRLLFIFCSGYVLAELDRRILVASRIPKTKETQMLPPELCRVLWPFLKKLSEQAYAELPADRTKRLLDPVTKAEEDTLVFLDVQKKVVGIVSKAAEAVLKGHKIKSPSRRRKSISAKPRASLPRVRTPPTSMD